MSVCLCASTSQLDPRTTDVFTPFVLTSVIYSLHLSVLNIWACISLRFLDLALSLQLLSGGGNVKQRSLNKFSREEKTGPSFAPFRLGNQIQDSKELTIKLRR